MDSCKHSITESMITPSGIPQLIRRLIYRDSILWTVFLVVPILLLYLRTMPRSLAWGDGIELSTASFVLGIPHPTGYPLYMLLGKVFSLIPFGTITWRSHFASVCYTVGALILFFHLLQRLRRVCFPLHMFPTRAYAGSIALAFALVFGTTRTVWRLGTVTEVYALHMLGIVAIIYISFLCVKQSDLSKFLLIFCLFILSMTHHMMALSAIPFVVLAAGTTLPHTIRKINLLRLCIIVIIITIAGCALYLYLPVRSRTYPPINWGNPSTIKNFLWVITGGEFKDFYFMKFPAGMHLTLERYLHFAFMRCSQIYSWLTREFIVVSSFGVKGQLLFILMIAGILGSGMAYLIARHPLFGVSLLLHLLLILAVVFVYGIYDIEDYFISLVPGLVILAFIGITVLQNLLETYFFRRKVNYINWLFLLLPALMASTHFSDNNRSDDYTADIYAERLFEAVPQDAIVITLGDNDIYPLWYYQIVKKRHPDVLVVGGNFIYSPWYSTFFTPEQLRGRTIRFEPKPISTEAVFYRDLSRWIIKPNIDSYPIFITNTSPFLEQMYRVEPVKILLTPHDYATTKGSFLPPPYLYSIQPIQ